MRLIAELVVELGEPRRIVRELIGKALEGDGLPELQIVSAVDLAHAAAAERRDDAEARGEPRAGRESTQSDPLLVRTEADSLGRRVTSSIQRSVERPREVGSRPLSFV